MVQLCDLLLGALESLLISRPDNRPSGVLEHSPVGDDILDRVKHLRAVLLLICKVAPEHLVDEEERCIAGSRLVPFDEARIFVLHFISPFACLQAIDDLVQRASRKHVDTQKVKGLTEAVVRVQFDGQLAETMAVSLLNPGKCRVEVEYVIVDRLEASVRLEVDVGLKVGDLVRVN
jgi:hypothetical protein